MENWEVKQEENFKRTPRGCCVLAGSMEKFRSRIKHRSMYFFMEIHENEPSTVKLKTQAIQNFREIKKNKK